MQRFSVVRYEDLNSRQQEIFNFQKVSGVLADYGFATLRLTDDWNGADFLAVHVDGKTFLRVQLKGRLTFEKSTWDKAYGSVFATVAPSTSAHTTSWLARCSKLPAVLAGSDTTKQSHGRGRTGAIPMLSLIHI